MNTPEVPVPQKLAHSLTWKKLKIILHHNLIKLIYYLFNTVLKQFRWFKAIRKGS